jgi:hypothetical protein
VHLGLSGRHSAILTHKPCARLERLANRAPGCHVKAETPVMSRPTMSR